MLFATLAPFTALGHVALPEEDPVGIEPRGVGVLHAVRRMLRLESLALCGAVFAPWLQLRDAWRVAATAAAATLTRLTRG